MVVIWIGLGVVVDRSCYFIKWNQGSSLRVVGDTDSDRMDYFSFEVVIFNGCCVQSHNNSRFNFSFRTPVSGTGIDDAMTLHMQDGGSALQALSHWGRPCASSAVCS